MRPGAQQVPGRPLAPRLGHFCRGIGVSILEGYGLTETTAPVSVNRPERLKIGSVGQPIPGVTVRIGDDNEILVRGKSIFTAYWHDEALKSQTDPNGNVTNWTVDIQSRPTVKTFADSTTGPARPHGVAFK